MYTLPPVPANGWFGRPSGIPEEAERRLRAIQVEIDGDLRAAGERQLHRVGGSLAHRAPPRNDHGEPTIVTAYAKEVFD
jgi:hypothetical protein